MDAVAIDQELLPLQATGLSGQVHSVFDRAWNLSRGDDGTLLAVTTEQAGLGPRGIAVGVASLPEVPVGAPWSLTAGRLVVGEQLIDLRDARPTGLTVPAPALLPELLERWCDLVEAAWLLAPADPFTEAVAELLETRMTDLARLAADVRTGAGTGGVYDPRGGADAQAGARAEIDTAAVTETVRGLVGLGVGLTPSGDDVLSGILVATCLPGAALAPLRLTIAAAVQDALALTVPISASFLTDAIRGRAHSRVLDLLHALAGHGDLHAAHAAVLEIGHRSGLDLSAGLALGLAGRPSPARPPLKGIR